jgi:hypothetical protein
MALADLARRSRNEEITTDLLYEVVCEWTTDEVTDEGPVGTDSMILGSYMIEHLSTQVHLRENVAVMVDIAKSLESHDIDPEKLIDQDPQEWQKLGMALAIGSDDPLSLDGELTVADILDAVSEDSAPVEGDWEVEARSRLIDKIDYQLFLQEVVAVFLKATLDGDSERLHHIIEDMGCELTHALANTLLIYVQSRSVLKDGETAAMWVTTMEEMSETVSAMDDDERIEYAQTHLVGLEDFD